MNEGIMQQAGSLEMLFWVCALVSTLFFVVRVALMVMSGAMDAGIDMDTGADVGGDGDLSAHHGAVSDAHFELISVNSITAFFMMFGWIGLTCYKQFGLNGGLSVGIGFIGGVVCMLITAYLFKAARRLVSRGSNFSLAQAVGRRGNVYQRIPQEGRGKVTVVVNDISRELDAMAEDGREIASFESIEVVRVIDQRTVAVRKI